MDEDIACTPTTEVSISGGGVDVTISVPGNYSPDVLDDLTHRAVTALVTTRNALIQTQDAA